MLVLRESLPTALLRLRELLLYVVVPLRSLLFDDDLDTELRLLDGLEYELLLRLDELEYEPRLLDELYPPPERELDDDEEWLPPPRDPLPPPPRPCAIAGVAQRNALIARIAINLLFFIVCPFFC